MSETAAVPSPLPQDGSQPHPLTLRCDSREYVLAEYDRYTANLDLLKKGGLLRTLDDRYVYASYPLFGEEFLRGYFTAGAAFYLPKPAVPVPSEEREPQESEGERLRAAFVDAYLGWQMADETRDAVSLFYAYEAAGCDLRRFVEKAAAPPVVEPVPPEWTIEATPSMLSPDSSVVVPRRYLFLKCTPKDFPEPGARLEITVRRKP